MDTSTTSSVEPEVFEECLRRVHNINEIHPHFAVQPLAKFAEQEHYRSKHGDYMLEFQGENVFFMLVPRAITPEHVRGIRMDIARLKFHASNNGAKTATFMDVDGDNNEVPRVWKLLGFKAPLHVWLGVEAL